jgi:polyphosphate kinase
VPGLSENISVVSIVDRFLEHARILYFYHGGDERLFISSADWMPRNLDRRVELLVPVEAAEAKQRLVGILDSYFQDNEKARQLLSDGTYQRVKGSKRKSMRSQERFYLDLSQVVAQAEQSRRAVFEPHRAPSNEELT